MKKITTGSKEVSTTGPEFLANSSLPLDVCVTEPISPSAPPLSQAACTSESTSPSAPPLSQGESTVVKDTEYIRSEYSRIGMDTGNTGNNDSSGDNDGFQVVQKKKSKNKTIIGLRKGNSNNVFKSAIKSADIYVGNCDVGVTINSLTSYILDELGIKIDNCEALENRNPKCKSFKISVNLKDRQKLLSSEVWPEGIICRKFFSPPRK